jgi:hypothetical protein
MKVFLPMKKICMYAILMGLLMPILFTHAQAESADEIRMTIPGRVMVRLIKAALPLNIENGPFLKGSLWIHTIDHLKIGSDRVSFEMNIRGTDIQLETRMGKQSLVMDLGSLNTTFDCTADLRYDAPSRILYVTPHLQPRSGDKGSQGANLVQLLSLANGVAFPVEIQKFQPFVTQIGRDQFNINMDITRIYTEQEQIFVCGLPRFKKEKQRK